MEFLVRIDLFLGAALLQKACSGSHLANKEIN